MKYVSVSISIQEELLSEIKKTFQQVFPYRKFNLSEYVRQACEEKDRNFKKEYAALLKGGEEVS